MEPNQKKPDKDEATILLAALPSEVSLEELGLSEEDLPVYDPETGKFVVNGAEFSPGDTFFLYNKDGLLLFGLTVGTGSIDVSVEAGFQQVVEREDVGGATGQAPEAAVAPPPAKKKKVKKETEAAPVSVAEETKAPPEDKAAGIEDKSPSSTAERRARAARRARERKTGRRLPEIEATVQPSVRNTAKLAIWLSSVICIFIIMAGVFWREQLANLLSNVKGTKKQPSSIVELFTPVEFASEEFQAIKASDEDGRKRLRDVGWEIVKPRRKPKWMLHESGLLDNGDFASGLIKMRRKGKTNFVFSVETGFVRPPKNLDPRKKKLIKKANLTIYINAPAAGISAYFGYGVDIGEPFLVVEEHGLKQPIRRCGKKDLKFSTWYQLKVVGERNKYVNFYLNGAKVESLRLPPSKVRLIGLSTFLARAVFRNVKLVEPDVKPAPPPKSPTGGKDKTTEEQPKP